MQSKFSTAPVTLVQRLPLSFCRKPDEPERLAGTLRSHECKALDFLMIAVMSFFGMVSRALS